MKEKGGRRPDVKCSIGFAFMPSVPIFEHLRLAGDGVPLPQKLTAHRWSGHACPRLNTIKAGRRIPSWHGHMLKFPFLRKDRKGHS